MARKRLSLLAALLIAAPLLSAQAQQTLGDWQMQDAAKVPVAPETVSTSRFKPAGWYQATVPGTVLTTLVANKVYPEPLYGENMRSIPESLNRASYWYRTSFNVPAAYRGRHIWLNFAGINYSAEVWINGHKTGTLRGAFLRGGFDITPFVKAGQTAVLAVLVTPQPHPGIPHEHTVALGVGQNGGDTAIDGPTFLSTIGWDWLPAIRDRDTGIWLPVTLSATGPVILQDPRITTTLTDAYKTADITINTTLENQDAKPVSGTLTGVIHGQAADISFHKDLTIAANASQTVTLDSKAFPELHLTNPRLWWPNGYGAQNLNTLTLSFQVGKLTSQSQSTSFGIRKIEYQVPDSENLTISVNGVRVMVRGGNWGLDEGLKRIPRDRLDAQFHMHALANLNMIRNWVGQSTSPDFYELADKYGILLWDEFFQPNPGDGPNVTDIPTYLANVTDKVRRFRNHPSIAVWCARNEGFPPKDLDDALKAIMVTLDPDRLYQSSSTDGRGVSSHGPYFWRSPRHFYALNESFKTETGSMSIPTVESIQGMMPEKDWETINDDWAQHDMAKGAQRGDEFPALLARRYGHIRNLADFARKGQVANYEAFRAMYEGRNAQMFTRTSGVLTWMSHPAQPSFVWQLYHYDLEPNSSLFAVKKAAEPVHVQLNESNGAIEIVNNRPDPLSAVNVRATVYDDHSNVALERTYHVDQVPGSRTVKAAQIDVPARVSALYFVKLDLTDSAGTLQSTNFYWQNVAQDDFTALDKLPPAVLDIAATSRSEGDKTILSVELRNPTETIALLAHLQLRHKDSGQRILPVIYSDNYISLVPHEARSISIEVATRDLDQQPPLITLDGYNVDVHPVEAPVSIRPNLNAQPLHWPASQLVP